MKIAEFILGALGILALAVIGIFFWFSIESSQLKAEAKPFTEAYIAKLSESWSFKDVEESTAVAMLSNINTPQGNKVINGFSQYGKLKKIHDYEAINVSVGMTDHSISYAFKAEFENTKVLGKIDIVRLNGSLKTIGIFFKPVEQILTNGNYKA